MNHLVLFVVVGMVTWEFGMSLRRNSHRFRKKMYPSKNVNSKSRSNTINKENLTEKLADTKTTAKRKRMKQKLSAKDEIRTWNKTFNKELSAFLYPYSLLDNVLLTSPENMSSIPLRANSAVTYYYDNPLIKSSKNTSAAVEKNLPESKDKDSSLSLDKPSLMSLDKNMPAVLDKDHPLQLSRLEERNKTTQKGKLSKPRKSTAQSGNKYYPERISPQKSPCNKSNLLTSDKIITIEKKGEICAKKAKKSLRKPKDSSNHGLNTYSNCTYYDENQIEKLCSVPNSHQCDGISSCSTDECYCNITDNTVFYCSDGSGCISMSQVCDTIPDCMDASDECVCEQYLNCNSWRGVAKICKTNIIRSEVCTVKINKQNDNVILRDLTKPVFKGLFSCLSSLEDQNREYTKIHPLKRYQNPQNHDLPKYPKIRKTAKDSEWNKQQTTLYSLCTSRCLEVKEHCKYLKYSEDGLENFHGESVVDPIVIYTCPNSGTDLTLSSDVDVCDGFIDCPHGEDERACKTRFYCKESNKSISYHRVCDNVADCPDLSDECENCMSANVSDDKYLISGRYLIGYMIVLFILIVTLNGKGIYCHRKIFYRDITTRSSSKVNELLCFQLGIYDFLMAIYIFIIILKYFQFYGTYCIHDIEWRTSSICNFGGFIFVFSSHGSLLTALIMAALRCYHCENMLVHFSTFKTTIGLGLCNIINFIFSGLVLLPFHSIENMFTQYVYFQNNRILHKASQQNINSLLLQYYGQTMNISHLDSLGWSGKLDLLANVTSDPSIFEPEKKIGFFNHSPLCIQNLFTRNEDASIYMLKAIYVSFLAILVITLSISYIWIVFIKFKKANTIAIYRGNSQKSASKSSIKLSRKISMIIGSQLFAWIPIITATAVTLADYGIPLQFYEVAAIVLIPTNSILNPLFHSTNMKKIDNMKLRKNKTGMVQTSEMNVFKSAPATL